MTKKDITTEQDIEDMVNGFYAKVNQDPLLSYVFNEHTGVDWKSHLPKMYAFWNGIVFGKEGYNGRPFAPHINLPIDDRHFDRWLELFTENMDEQFEGETADRIKERAYFIGKNFRGKLTYINKMRND